jgi:hypothetical protein
MTNPSIEEILTAARQGQKIELIKLYRGVSGHGLKDSKDAIESCEQPGRRFDEYKLINTFFIGSGGDKTYRPEVYEPDFLNKEEFLRMIGNAIDVGKTMQCHDMLHAVKIFIDNIEMKGGLNALALEREKFIDNL